MKRICIGMIFVLLNISTNFSWNTIGTKKVRDGAKKKL